MSKLTSLFFPNLVFVNFFLLEGRSWGSEEETKAGALFFNSRSSGRENNEGFKKKKRRRYFGGERKRKPLFISLPHPKKVRACTQNPSEKSERKGGGMEDEKKKIYFFFHGKIADSPVLFSCARPHMSCRSKPRAYFSFFFSFLFVFTSIKPPSISMSSFLLYI